MKCLYAGGDSWCEGDELGLPYDPVTTPVYRYKNSWPSLLATQLRIPITVNDGLRGTSGSRIYRRATRFIRNWLQHHRASDLTVVLGWTTLERDEVPIDVDYKGVKAAYYIPYHWHQYNLPTMSERMTVESVVLESLKRIHDSYTLTLGTTSREQIQLERMLNLQLLCDSVGVRLLQTWALDPDRTFCNTVPQLPVSFVEYCRQYGLATGSGGHGLESAHTQWALTLKDYHDTVYS